MIYKVKDDHNFETIESDPKVIAEFVVFTRNYHDSLYNEKVIKEKIIKDSVKHQKMISEIVIDINKLKIGQKLRITIDKEYKMYIYIQPMRTNLKAQTDALKEGSVLGPTNNDK